MLSQGVAMLSSVPRSPRAVAVNIEIMRTFVKLHQLAATRGDLGGPRPVQAGVRCAARTDDPAGSAHGLSGS